MHICRCLMCNCGFCAVAALTISTPYIGRNQESPDDSGLYICQKSNTINIFTVRMRLCLAVCFWNNVGVSIIYNKNIK